MNKILLILVALLVCVNFVNAVDDANVQITKAITTPSSVEPGKVVSLLIEIENIGEVDAQDVFVKLGLEDIPFALNSGASVKSVGDLDEGDEETVTYSLTANNDVTSGTYQIPIEVIYSYEADDGNDTKIVRETTEGFVSIIIAGKPSLIVNVDNSYGIIGQKGTVDIQFTNRGRGDIKFLTVNIKDIFGYDVLSNKQVYVGDVDSDDFETISFEIMPFTDDPELEMEVQYEDFEGNKYNENYQVKLQTYTTNEARALGLIPPNNNWIFGVVVVLIIIFFIVRKLRKKRKNHAV